MTRITFNFDRVKAIEVILYLANRISDHDIYGICKLLYLADKTSLEKYGRFIFGESYCAMKQGATPSNAYDLLKEIDQNTIDEFKMDGYLVIPVRDANLDYLSKSDIECLDKIISLYGNVPNWVRRNEAHDAAWSYAWGKRGNKESVEMPVESIAEMLADSDDLISYLSDRGAD